MIKAGKLELPIIFEDQDILITNKPFGVVVNRSDSYAGPTVQDWMEERIVAETVAAETDWREQVPSDYDSQYGTPEEIFTERIGMVHRLDKDTSGALVLAKNPGALANLLSQFKKREVEKTYTCLTHGRFLMDSGEVKLPIGRRPDNRKLFGIVPGGRPAATTYQVLEFFPNFRQDLLASADRQNKRFSLYQGFSLVECKPKTGRTHQIRVHMQHLQHPIVGDSTYVGKKRSKLDSLWCSRQFLHASEISFAHPRTGEPVVFKAELPPDLKRVLQFVGT